MRQRSGHNGERAEAPRLADDPVWPRTALASGSGAKENGLHAARRPRAPRLAQGPSRNRRENAGDQGGRGHRRLPGAARVAEPDPARAGDRRRHRRRGLRHPQVPRCLAARCACRSRRGGTPGRRPMGRGFARRAAGFPVRVAVLNGRTAPGIPVTQVVGQVRPERGSADRQRNCAKGSRPFHVVWRRGGREQAAPRAIEGSYMPFAASQAFIVAISASWALITSSAMARISGSLPNSSCTLAMSMAA